VERSPSIAVDKIYPIFGFSPKDAGFEWVIDNRPIRAIFYLKPNHGGESYLEPCTDLDIIQKIMPMSYAATPRKQIKDVCRLVQQAESYQLRIGDLDKALTCMRDAMKTIH
jgi:hypothetical protein